MRRCNVRSSGLAAGNACDTLPHNGCSLVASTAAALLTFMLASASVVVAGMSAERMLGSSVPCCLTRYAPTRRRGGIGGVMAGWTVLNSAGSAADGEPPDSDGNGMAS